MSQGSRSALAESDVRALYDRMAFSYDFWGRLTDSTAHQRALDLAKIANGETVLEVGCGSGLMFARIAAANPDGRSFGCDISRGMLTRAAEKVAGKTGIALQLASARHLPYREESFDVVVAAYLLDILPGTESVDVLREWARVAKPGARLVAVDMTHGEHWYNRFWGRLYSLSPKLMGGCRPVDVFPYLQDAGWEPGDREYITQNTFPSEIVTATKPR